MPSKQGLHPLAQLMGIVILASVLTWILPAGQYDRMKDTRTGRTLVVPGSYHPVERNPAGPWSTLMAVPLGLLSAGKVIFYVLLSGAAMTVIEATGAMSAVVDSVGKRLSDRPLWVIPAVSMLFLAGGASYGMYEEVLAFIPVLCVLGRRMGFDGVAMVAASLGTATVAGAFSPVNTFLLGISQPMAELPLFSGMAFRTVIFIAAMAIWFGFLWLYGRKTRRVVTEPADRAIEPASGGRQAGRRTVILVAAALNATMVMLVIGAALWNWGLEEFAAAMLGMGVACGLLGGLGVQGTAAGFADGFRRMAYAAVLIGVARAILVTLENGRVLDTIAWFLFSPLNHAGREASGVFMLAAQWIISVPIPSDSGKAMVTLPVLVPLSDLLGVSRQVLVSAYTSSTVISGIVTPTGGTILAILAMAEVSLTKWLKAVAPVCAALLVLSLAATVIGTRLGLR